MYNHKPESTRCTALTHRGAFCDYESLPDAPFPICVKHAALLLRFLNGAMPTDLDDRVILAARDFEYRPVEQRRSATAGVGVVYYLRVGAHIKRSGSVPTFDKGSTRIRPTPFSWLASQGTTS